MTALQKLAKNRNLSTEEGRDRLVKAAIKWFKTNTPFNVTEGEITVHWYPEGPRLTASLTLEGRFLDFNLPTFPTEEGFFEFDSGPELDGEFTTRVHGFLDLFFGVNSWDMAWLSPDTFEIHATFIEPGDLRLYQ